MAIKEDAYCLDRRFTLRLGEVEERWDKGNMAFK